MANSLSGADSYFGSNADAHFWDPASHDHDYDVLTSFNFTLRVEGAMDIPVKSVRGINKQNEYEYIQEGGLNDYVHMVRKQISQPFQFQVERYVSQDVFEDTIDPLSNGTELTLPLILYIYRGSLGSNKAPVRYYIFNNCRVMGVQVGDLDAEKSGLHTITNTIAYSQMLVFTLPAGTVDEDDIYKFNKDGKAQLERINARTMGDFGLKRDSEVPTYDPDDPKTHTEDNIKKIKGVDQRVRTKNDMIALSRKYQIIGADKKGGKWPKPNPSDWIKNRSPKVEQLSKEQLEENAQKYEIIGKSSRGGKDPAPNPSDWVAQPEGQLSKQSLLDNAKGYTPLSPTGQLSKEELEGNAKEYTPESPKGQLSKEQLEAKAQKTHFDNKKFVPSKKVKTPPGQVRGFLMEARSQKYDPSDSNTWHAVQPPNQMTKDQLEANVRKRLPIRSPKAVADFLK